MFFIRELLVSPEQEEHIWSRHHITLEEAEEVCFSQVLAVRGKDRSFAIYGQTVAGRYLVAILYPRHEGVYSLATARAMTQTERRGYHQHRQRR